MPFGAKMSQDIFQLRMDAILEQCPGVIGIHDDIVIFGTSNEDHDCQSDQPNERLPERRPGTQQQEAGATKGTCHLLRSRVQ